MALPAVPTARPSSTGPLINASAAGGAAANTITLGGTAQVLLTEAADRRYFFFHNISANTMWINFGSTAVADTPSIKVAANSSLEYADSYVPGDEASLMGTTTGDKYVCKVG